LHTLTSKIIEMIPENLIIKYLANEASDREIDALYEWLSEDSRNQKLLSDYMKIYDRSYEDEVLFDENKGLNILRDRIRETNQVPQSSVAMVMKIAASFLLIAVSILGIYYYQSISNTTEYVIKENPNGQKSTFQLPDGSIVKLNAGSKLKYPESFSKNKRLVSLQGEAFFEVVEDKNKPFVVLSKGVRTTVLGTSFNVKQGSDVVVSLLEGKVEVTDSLGGLVTLSPGEEAQFKNGFLTKTQANLDRQLAWKDNVLVFEKDDLKSVKDRLEVWYGVEVDIDSAVAGDCLFTGRFKNENLINVLEAIKFSTDLNFNKEGKIIKVFGEGCK